MQSIPGKNYRHIRWMLITKSLALSIVTERLRQMLEIPLVGRRLKDKSTDSIINATIVQSKKIGKDKIRILNNIADNLNAGRTQFKDFIFFNVIGSPLNHGLRLVFVDKPLDEPGAYLKVDSFTTEDELGKEFRHMKLFIRKTMAPIIYRTRMRKKSTGLNPAEEKFYIKLEKKIKEYFHDKKFVSKQTKESYSSIVRNAMNELAGEEIPENLPSNLWDKVVKKRGERLRMQYYSITERYGLPTVTDLPKLLALIPNN